MVPIGGKTLSLMFQNLWTRATFLTSERPLMGVSKYFLLSIWVGIYYTPRNMASNQVKNHTPIMCVVPNKPDKALVYLLIYTFKFGLLSFLNKLKYFLMWTSLQI